MDELFRKLKEIRHNIRGIHLWGKGRNSKGKPIAHLGDLNSYFDYDMDFKEAFLLNMLDTFDDGMDRYFVPEVNSGTEDLLSIVNDLRRVGFKFK